MENRTKVSGVPVCWLHWTLKKDVPQAKQKEIIHYYFLDNGHTICNITQIQSFFKLNRASFKNLPDKSNIILELNKKFFLVCLLYFVLQ